jgi:hypothetical protein
MSPVIPGKPDLMMGGKPVASSPGVPFEKKDDDKDDADDKKDKDDDSKHEKGESKKEEEKEHEGKSEKEEDKADKKMPWADKKASLRAAGPYMERQPGDYLKKRD